MTSGHLGNYTTLTDATNKWLYPDLVAMEDLSRDWDKDINDSVSLYADKRTKLWSFEVKVLINRSNVREVFFQAVSNSVSYTHLTLPTRYRV